MASIGDWEVETGGTLGVGYDCSPVQYPRSQEDRDIGTQNKNAASQHELPTDAVKINTDGNTNVPRHADTPINYEEDGDTSADDSGSKETDTDA